MRAPQAGAALHSWHSFAHGDWQALGITLQRLWLYLPCKTDIVLKQDLMQSSWAVPSCVLDIHFRCMGSCVAGR